MENEEKQALSLDEVKGFLESNIEKEDVKDYLQGFNPLSKLNGKGLKEINQILENDENLKLIKSYRDLFFEEGMKKFKGEKLPEIIKNENEKYFNEKYKAMNPPENQEEVMRREFEERIQKLETERKKDQLKSFAFKLSKDENIIPYIMGNSEEEIENKYTVLTDIIQKREAAAAQKIRDNFKKQASRDVATPISENKNFNIDNEIKKAITEGRTLDAIALKRQKFSKE